MLEYYSIYINGAAEIDKYVLTRKCCIYNWNMF